MGNANILIVEDDKVCAQIFAMTLSEEGHAIFFCHDGKNVDKLVDDNNIDIILLDIVMPGLSGYDILRMLRASERTIDIPVIVLTGLSAPDEVKRALDCGALDFIRKPCEPIELIARVSSALRLLQKQRMLNEQAQKDALTQLYNRRYFNKHIEKYISSAGPNGAALVMIDCDDFKKVNDKYGHSVGDDVLEEVARVLSKSARDGDIPFRFGGEEFCLILPNTTILKACELTERIRRKIEKTPFLADGESFSITVSCGICNSNQFSENNLRQFIDAADSALYSAKKNGRNRIEFFHP